ncbi:mRNA triphosphatase CET1 [Serendipita vermifera]|nr:mRNA triphosphatase CET1 [Serendipita vermifera]
MSKGGPYTHPLEPSFLNTEPQDEFVKEIADWIAFVSGGRQNIEVEAKFGVVLDKSSGTRVVQRLGVLVETILNPREAQGVRFESKLHAKQHEHLNRMLNDRAASTASSSYRHTPLSARHLQTMDEFFSLPSSHSTDDIHGDAKLRVTRDDKTGQLVECIVKKRLGDLHVLCPKREVDWRISVNVEEKGDLGMIGVGDKPLYSRKKDRMEYAHQHFKIDLTQVTDQAGVRTHELEVEFAYPDEVRRILELRGKDGPEMYGYDQLVAVFVNNCRILSRNVIRI